MNRAEAIKHLEEWIEVISIPSRKKAVNMAIEALQGDWILVSERLPEVGRSVLISDGVWTAEGCYRADGRWHQFRWDYEKDDVIAWKPLPMLYGESEDE